MRCVSDSLQVIEAAKNSSTDFFEVRQIMEDIKVILSTITEVTITHTRCQANGIAHMLARYGISLSHACDWYNHPPSVILDLLVEESIEP